MDRRTFLGGMASSYVAIHSQAANAVASALEKVSSDAQDAAHDENFWLSIRQAFSIDGNFINLNSGSVSPSPQVVQDAMEDYLTVMNMNPSYYVEQLLSREKEIVRGRLAKAFGCDTEEIAITRNTTEALENVILGIELSAGDEVLTTNQDYISMLWSWRQRAQRDGIVLRTIRFPAPPPDMAYLVDAFERAITPKTRVIMLSHVTYTTGQIFPVREICELARDRGIQTIVDGAHSFAHIPFSGSALGCDYYGTSLHKWLTAPIGTGFLYVRKERIPDVWPLMPANETLTDNIRKFEAIGTYPVATKNAIGAALTFHDSIGMDRKAARLHYLRRRWSSQVEHLKGVRLLNHPDPSHACAIGAMSIDGVDARKLADHLVTEYNIHVRARVVNDEFSAIRVVPNIFTSTDELDHFSSAIRRIVDQGF